MALIEKALKSLKWISFFICLSAFVWKVGDAFISYTSKDVGTRDHWYMTSRKFWLFLTTFPLPHLGLTLGNVIEQTQNIKKPLFLPKLSPFDKLIVQVPSNGSYNRFTFKIFEMNRLIFKLNQFNYWIELLFKKKLLFSYWGCQFNWVLLITEGYLEST